MSGRGTRVARLERGRGDGDGAVYVVLEQELAGGDLAEVIAARLGRPLRASDQVVILRRRVTG